MPRIAYVNGRYVPHSNAMVHVEDRGYQFADGVYEVCEVRHGLIVDLTRHLNRLDRSLSELRIAWPMSRAALTQVIRETLRRNHVRNGLFYLQVTRGVARRDHVFPAEGTPPSIVVTAKSTRSVCHCQEECRWHQGDHRSRQSLGSCRHQDGRAAVECACPPAGEGKPVPRKRFTSMPMAW